MKILSNDFKEIVNREPQNIHIDEVFSLFGSLYEESIKQRELFYIDCFGMIVELRIECYSYV